MTPPVAHAAAPVTPPVAHAAVPPPDRATAGTGPSGRWEAGGSDTTARWNAVGKETSTHRDAHGPDSPSAGGVQGPAGPPPRARTRHVLTLTGLAVLLLGVLPLVLFVRASGHDPALANLDSLSLPGWAAEQHQDEASGSRYCFQTCRLRERTWRSAKSAKETDPVFQAALRDAGWEPSRTAGCPKPGTGSYSCWQRDQYVLDLWTRDAVCDLSGVAPSPGAPVPTISPSSAPLLDPAPASSPTAAPKTCGGALVTVNVGERIDPNWHR